MRQGRPAKPSIREIRPGVFQVRATTPTGRKKQSFPSLRAAEMQLSRWLDDDATLEMRPTALSAAQLRDAERALVLLEELGVSFLDGARWLRAHYRPPAKVTFADAIKEFMDALEAKGTSERRRSKVRLSLVALGRFLRREEIGHITREEIENFLLARVGRRSARTWNHAVADLSQFFNWHTDRGTLAGDPTKGVTRKVVRNVLPKVVAPDQAKALMQDLEANFPRWIPFAALLLFGGIRPDGEIGRLDAELRASQTGGKSPFRADGIEVEGKSHGRRFVPFKNCGPLEKWLAAYPPDPVNGLFPSPRKRRKFADEWQKVIWPRHGLSRDLLRHSAGTAMISAGLNSGTVMLTLGNSHDSLRKYYLNPLCAVGPEYAEALYSIVPQKA